MKIQDAKTALEIFEEAALAHTEASERGDHKTANRKYSAIEQAITFLRDQREIQLVSQLLFHESAGVRVWAASYLLPIQEGAAVQVLKSVASGPRGIARLNAETTLSEWQKEKLTL